jgi:hypothetical protein
VETVGAALVIGVALGVLLIGNPVHEATLAAQAMPALDGDIEAIIDHEQALAASFERWPPNVPVEYSAARRLTMASADRWLGVQTSDIAPDHPVWLVGLRGSNLTVSDIIRVPGAESTDARPVVGAFYVWDATTAYTLYEGPLMSARDFIALAAIADEDLQIVRATPPPPLPTLDPDSIPTDAWAAEVGR